MNDEKNLQELILAYERALLDLKTSYNIAPSVNTNVVKYRGSNTSVLTILYDNGDEDIITNVFSSSSGVLGTITNNSQKIFFDSPVSSADIISTRKIREIVL